MEEIRDGDILCFQRADISRDAYSLPTVADYFRYRIWYTFIGHIDVFTVHTTAEISTIELKSVFTIKMWSETQDSHLLSTKE